MPSASFFCLFVSSAKRKNCSAGSVLLCKALQEGLPSSAVFAQPRPVIAVPPRLFLSRPSSASSPFAIHVLRPPRAVQICRLLHFSHAHSPRLLFWCAVSARLVVGQGATAADRSHHRHSLVATFITFPLLFSCLLRFASWLAARTIARPIFPPDRNPCVAVSMHSIPLPIAATST